MATRTVTFRLPEDIVALLNAQAEATGKAKTTLVIEAIARAYKPEVSGSGNSDPVVRQQISTLKSPGISSRESELPAHLKLYDRTSQIVSALQDAIDQPDDVGLSVACVIVQAEGPSEQAHSELSDSSSRRSDQPFLARNPSQYPIDTLDLILAAIPEPVFVCDRLGKLAYLNPAGARTWRVDRKMTLGKTFKHINLPIISDFCDRYFQIILTSGQAIQAEIAVPLLGGARYYHYHFYPIQDGNACIDGMIGIAQDVTEHIQTRQTLQESYEKYRSFFECANDLIMMVDLTSQILEVNQCAARRLGYIRKDLEHQSIETISSPEASRQWQDAMIPELEKSGSVVFNHTFRRKTGEDIPVEVSGRLIECNNQLAFLWIARDLSQR
jgi:PAS domain S-box-containing protein